MVLTKDSLLVAGPMNMPVVGLLGTALMTDPQASCEDAVKAAVDAGYRHFDTAFMYSREKAVGKALRECIQEGKVTREELFVVTKLEPNCMRPMYVEPYLKKSLKQLGLDYVDLFLVHHPCGFLHDDEDWFYAGFGEGKAFYSQGPDTEADLVKLWKEMEEQVEAGLTKSIGVSNFNIKQLERILANATIPPANLQVELHIYLQQSELVSFCRSKGITVCAYSPLGSPALKDTMKEFSKIKWWMPLEDPTVLSLAAKHKKTAGQVLLRFLLQCEIAVVPKSATPERIKQNIDVFDFELSESEMNQLRALDKGEEGRLIRLDFIKGLRTHPENPF